MKHSIFVVAGSLCALILLPHVAACEDDVQALRGQITELRQQLIELRREFDGLRRELKPEGTKSEKPFITEKPSAKNDEGQLLGIVWELDVLKPDGSVFTTTRFLAADGKLYHDSREVGTYAEQGNRVRMDILRNVGDRALGVAELLRTSNKPPTYHGRFTNKQGENPKVRLRMILD
jgi:hypothetical protein